MEYRINRRTGDQISILGLGSGSSGFAAHAPFDEMVRILEYAFEQGIYFYDLCCGSWICYEAYAAAHGGVRDQVHYQMHFGIDYSTGRYGWTTELDAIKRSIEKELKTLKTDYIDYGFIHCIDEDSDLKQYIDNGVLDYIQALKVLDRPGVLTLVPGIKSLSELKNYLGFLEASVDEKDYSAAF